MNKLEYFGKVIKVVTELMDVEDKDIIGRARGFDVVDARWMVIFLMREKGYSSKQIAPLINHPVRTINHALNMFSARVSNSSSSISKTLAIARQQLKE
jgi:chromosomal replication initiation ATPase DnaA